VWGGELLFGDLRGARRVGHLVAVRQPGGDRAARQPWRMAAAWLVACGAEAPARPRTLRDVVARESWETVCEMARRGFSAPVTSSMGRLFDAVAALCGLRARCTYEGQAAVELEAAADTAHRGAYELPVTDGLVLDARPMVRAIVDELAGGVPVEMIAARFHHGVADATAVACARAAEAAGTDRVVLSGGVWQNRLLLEWTTTALQERALQVLVPRTLPVNDGGISFGQVAVAAARDGAMGGG
jgi:hydrogenase maturation protein HypF